MKNAGQADVEIDVVDVSVIISSGLKGINGFFGVTERGDIAKPKLIGSWESFQNSFGGLIAESDFPLICKRALEGGGRLKVGRVGHYTDITDSSTLVGTKASFSKAIASAIAETRATSTLTVTNAGTTGNTYSMMIKQGNTPKVLGTATTVASDTVTLFAGRIVTAINAGTASHGYSAANVAGVVTITAPVGSGAGANAYLFDNSKTGTIAVTIVGFSGGVTAEAACVLSAEANDIGAWANSKLYMYSTASRTVANTWDLTVGLVGNSRVTVSIPSIPLNPSAGNLANYNALLSGLAKLNSITTMGAFATGYFTGGAEDKTLITYIDHIGDSAAETGIHMYDQSMDITKIAAPALVIPEFDILLAEYANTRKDIISLHTTPLGVSDTLAIDYREGTGAYSHSPINSWRSTMWTGGIRFTHPVTGAPYNITELGDLAAVMSKKDSTKAEWWSSSGSKRGRVGGALGVVKNFRSPALKLNADNLSIHGINTVIQHETFGTVFWDNMTLYKSSTLLKFLNVAELLVFMTRALKPLTESELFDPNDIETWKQIYRNVKPLMESIKSGRGIWDYLYQGDQDIDDVSQLTDTSVNSPASIDTGAYKFRLFIQPKVAMKFIGVEVVVTNSGVDFNELISEGV